MTPKEKEDILNLLDEAIAQNKGLQELVNSMINIEDLITRNYNAQIRRGQINDKTEPHNFLTKINEELEEVMCSDTWEEMADEVNDLKMVCESFLYFLHKIGYVSRTPQQIHIDKVDYNEKRPD